MQLIYTRLHWKRVATWLRLEYYFILLYSFASLYFNHRSELIDVGCCVDEPAF